MTAQTITDFSAFPADAVFTCARDGKQSLYISRTTESVETLRRRFDAFDAKGRQFGASVYISTEVRAVNAEARSISDWIGSKFKACPQATRNGIGYGASQRDHYFETLEAAHEWAARYFVEAEKRALKNKARAK